MILAKEVLHNSDYIFSQVVTATTLCPTLAEYPSALSSVLTLVATQAAGRGKASSKILTEQAVWIIGSG
jgi:hypothetical protein